MATGALPFSGESAGVIFDGIMNRAPSSALRLNPALPVAFEHVLEKSLEKDREMRYQSAAELRADLKRIQRSSDSGRMSSVTTQTEARPRSKRGIVVRRPRWSWSYWSRLEASRGMRNILRRIPRAVRSQAVGGRPSAAKPERGVRQRLTSATE